MSKARMSATRTSNGHSTSARLTRPRRPALASSGAGSAATTVTIQAGPVLRPREKTHSVRREDLDESAANELLALDHTHGAATVLRPATVIPHHEVRAIWNRHRAEVTVVDRADVTAFCLGRLGQRNVVDEHRATGHLDDIAGKADDAFDEVLLRSEERRVGKEWIAGVVEA